MFLVKNLSFSLSKRTDNAWLSTNFPVQENQIFRSLCVLHENCDMTIFSFFPFFFYVFSQEIAIRMFFSHPKKIMKGMTESCFDNVNDFVFFFTRGSFSYRHCVLLSLLVFCFYCICTFLFVISLSSNVIF